MNIIVLGKKRDKDGRLCVVEREDSSGNWWPIKYGDWTGDWREDWYYWDESFYRHPFSSEDFKLTDYPLVPVAYDGQYALVVLADDDYELFTNERLVEVGPADGKLIIKTIREMWR